MKDINKRHIRGFLRDYINKKYILENIELLEPKEDVNVPTLEDYGCALKDIVDIIVKNPLESQEKDGFDVDIGEDNVFWVYIYTALEDDEGDYLHLRIDGSFDDNDITIKDIDIRDSNENIMIKLTNDLKEYNEDIIAKIKKLIVADEA